MRSRETHARPAPTMAAGIASTTLSVRSCLTSRRRPAPIEARTASSVCRADPRASSRPATLTMAMIRMSPTAPASTFTVVREREVAHSSLDSTTARVSRAVPSGHGLRGVLGVSRSLACAMVTPGCSRANTSTRPVPLRENSLIGTCCAVASGVALSNQAGRTPTMVTTSASSRMVFPRTSSRPPYRLCQ